jgi:predicted DNA-binding transcriptional regulator YafY
MDKLHRIARLKRILNSRRTPITLRGLMDAMECSESTARRLLYSYRDDFGAPIAYDHKRRGWYLEQRPDEQPEELPGTWFTPAELHALLTARELLRQIQPGLLAEQTAPIAQRIERLLKDRGVGTNQIVQRIRLINIGARACAGDTFVVVTHALFDRTQLRIRYHGRGRAPEQQPQIQSQPEDGDQQGQPRDISPQRLNWYRGGWFLDAWCHRADALRRFSIERIADPQPLDTAAREIPDQQLDQHLAGAFGIFTGPPTANAVLRFTAYRARWVAEETWHPDQQSSWLPDGRYQLALPYAHHQELLMDILKYGPDCEIVGPPELRAAAIQLLRDTLTQYEPAKP